MAKFKLRPDDLPEETQLTVPVISLPFPYTITLWNYCSLYHEVGHPVDEDLGIGKALPLEWKRTWFLVKQCGRHGLERLLSTRLGFFWEEWSTRIR